MFESDDTHNTTENTSDETVSHSLFNVIFEVSDKPGDYEAQGLRGVQVRLTGQAVPQQAEGWDRSLNGGLIKVYGLHQACQSDFWGKVVGDEALGKFVDKPESVVTIDDRITGSKYSIPYTRIRELFQDGKQTYEPKGISDLLKTISAVSTK